VDEIIKSEKSQWQMVPSQWALNDSAKTAMKKAGDMIKRSRAASSFSRIPLKCKGERCVFRGTCTVEDLGLEVRDIEGQVCPLEAAEIINRFGDYLTEFNIDPENKEQSTMLGFVKELVDCDIMSIRAESRLQDEGHFLEDRCVGISQDGEPIFNREISKNYEFKARIDKRRSEILQLLNATPKDKAGSKITIQMDPSTYATSLLKKAKMLSEAMEVEGNPID
jgi:hypothetical protein